MLMRMPIRIYAEDVAQAVKAGWGPSALDSTSGNFIEAGHERLILSLEDHLIMIVTGEHPYDVGSVKKYFSPQQRDVWDQHKSWMAVDYVRGVQDLGIVYATLSRLTAAFVDENCVAIWVPREKTLIPSDSALKAELQKLASAGGWPSL
jgi:hypothetical protein